MFESIKSLVNIHAYNLPRSRETKTIHPLKLGIHWSAFKQDDRKSGFSPSECEKLPCPLLHIIVKRGRSGENSSIRLNPHPKWLLTLISYISCLLFQVKVSVLSCFYPHSWIPSNYLVFSPPIPGEIPKFWWNLQHVGTFSSSKSPWNPGEIPWNPSEIPLNPMKSH